jgi:hypothetical protein
MRACVRACVRARMPTVCAFLLVLFTEQVSSGMYGCLGLAAAMFSEVTPVWAIGASRPALREH